MAEVLIRLERPALVTPELRTWISQRLGHGRAVLSRSRMNGSERGTLLLRVELDGNGSAAEDVTDLITDLRLLGLRPSVVGEQAT